MNRIQWQKLDPQNIPELPGVYAFLWRRQWLYVGKAPNLRESLLTESWPYRIAQSLDEAELLWMPTEYQNDMEAKLRRMLRMKWRDLGETTVYSDYPCCDLPVLGYQEERRMLARSLTHG